MHIDSFVRLGLNLVMGLALVGCASGPEQVHTSVQSFATAAAQGRTDSGNPIVWRGARYRFDVLPSQTGLNLAPLQQMAEAALARHGLVREDAVARYAVQVVASVRPTWVADAWVPYPAGPWRPSWHLGLGWGHPGWAWGLGWSGPMATRTFVRELRLAIVLIENGQTVYETRAVNESPGTDHDAIFSVMMNAALHQFPHAPAGWQQVRTPLLQPHPATPAPAQPAPDPR